MAEMKKESNKTKDVQDQGFALPKENIVWILLGLGVMVLGYILMVGGGSSDPNVFHEDKIFSFRRIVLAPALIFIGFIFEIWAIMRIRKTA